MKALEASHLGSLILRESSALLSHARNGHGFSVLASQCGQGEPLRLGESQLEEHQPCDLILPYAPPCGVAPIRSTCLSAPMPNHSGPNHRRPRGTAVPRRFGAGPAAAISSPMIRIDGGVTTPRRTNSPLRLLATPALRSPAAPHRHAHGVVTLDRTEQYVPLSADSQVSPTVDNQHLPAVVKGIRSALDGKRKSPPGEPAGFQFGCGGRI